MYISFREEFDLPIGSIFPYFKSPSNWAKLYGTMKPTKALEDDWYAVPLMKFPFPLKAKNVEYQHDEKVRWIFGGFWSGVGEVNFSTKDNKTIVEGFEFITPHGLWIFSSLFEKHFMEKQFKMIWKLGWRKIRQNK